MLADARTDIYSAGVMLFQLLTGRLPLWGEAAYDYLREHLMGVPLTLAQGKKDANWCDGIERLLASMLAKDPNDRPPSCAAILELLRGGLRDETLATLKAPLEEEIPGTGLFNTFFKMWKRCPKPSSIWGNPLYSAQSAQRTAESGLCVLCDLRAEYNGSDTPPVRASSFGLKDANDRNSAPWRPWRSWRFKKNCWWADS